MPSGPAIRLSLPSKGRLQESALDFLSASGFPVFKPNPRQYQAEIPALPGDRGNRRASSHVCVMHGEFLPPRFQKVFPNSRAKA